MPFFVAVNFFISNLIFLPLLCSENLLHNMHIQEFVINLISILLYKMFLRTSRVSDSLDKMHADDIMRIQLLFPAFVRRIFHRVISCLVCSSVENSMAQFKYVSPRSSKTMLVGDEE